MFMNMLQLGRKYFKWIWEIVIEEIAVAATTLLLNSIPSLNHRNLETLNYTARYGLYF